jgi:glycosyltransferase involved in cell wall biosynthesis
MTRIVVVGQTPPPFHGQAIMIQEMLAYRYAGAELFHVRMGFSSGIDDVGRASPRKVLELFRVIARILVARLWYRADVLYYPPSGPNLLPGLRDIVVLLAVRPAFRHSIFHFHAGNLERLYDRLPKLGRILFRLAYFSPTIGIRVSGFAPDDPALVRARKSVVVWNGVPDRSNVVRRERPADARLRLLYPGLLSPEKGCEVLLHAAGILAKKGYEFELSLMGQAISREYDTKLAEMSRNLGIGERVHMLGHRSGDAKWREFADADIVCIPSISPSETFGVAAVEGMMFALPVVASRWRGLQEIVADGITGFLAEPGNAFDFASRLEELLGDAPKRRTFGTRGRERYHAHFTVEQYRRGMQLVFDALAA